MHFYARSLQRGRRQLSGVGAGQGVRGAIPDGWRWGASAVGWGGGAVWWWSGSAVARAGGACSGSRAPSSPHAAVGVEDGDVVADRGLLAVEEVDADHVEADAAIVQPVPADEA